MRRPYGEVDNPDVIDQRGAPPPEGASPDPSDGTSQVWDGASPLVLKSDHDRVVRDLSLAFGVIALGAYVAGEWVGRSSSPRARASRVRGDWARRRRR